MAIELNERTTKQAFAFGTGARAAGVLFAATTLLLISTIRAPSASAADKDCNSSSTGLIPLTELGSSTYLGYQGGLYPNGTNSLPDEHLRIGIEQSSHVLPRNQLGAPAAQGLIGLLAVGVSNTRIEFAAFEDGASRDPAVSSSLMFVNGAQGSRPLEDWAAGPTAKPWRAVDHELAAAGVSALQIQVAWIKLPNSSRGTVDLENSAQEIDQLVRVLQLLTDKFPNLRLGYFSSRIYGGYAQRSDARSTVKNGPEPKAYQHGFTVKWLIERQIDEHPELNAIASRGSVETPWIGWGPYLWADGLTSRQDGLIWECRDLADDGIHPDGTGADKVASLLLEHFSTDPSAAGWFLESTEQATATSPASTVSGTTSSSIRTASTVRSDESTSTTDSKLSVKEDYFGMSAAAFTLIIAALTLLATGLITRKRSRP